MDAKGRPIKVLLSAGNSHDSLFAIDLVEGQSDRTILADKAYDTDAIRAFFDANGLGACIPSKENRKKPILHHKGHYKRRHLVENCFQRMKEFRAIATRYEKLDERFLGLTHLAAILTWM